MLENSASSPIPSSGSNLSTSLIKVKCVAALVHGLFTVAVAIVTGWIVYGLWYPNGLAALSGGADLYKLILLVEIGLGPLISLVIFNPSKPKKELFRDYSIVALIQLSALAYGFYAVSIVRPVFLVFVKDRIEVVASADLLDDDLMLAKEERFAKKSITGPVLVCYDRPTDSEELTDIMFTSAAGKDVHRRPEYYRDCLPSELKDVAKPLAALEKTSADTEVLTQYKFDPNDTDNRSLPIVYSGMFWSLIFADENADEYQVIPMDSYGK